MSVFDNNENVLRYESWFKKNKAIFYSEVHLLQKVIPDGVGFEVGIGTGLFAKELGVRMGNDPSSSMLDIANKRNLITYHCRGDSLPFHDGYFDFILMVTTICFLDDVMSTLAECYRVLRQGGSIIIGFVDKDSQIGKSYLSTKNKSLFYENAQFYSVNKVKSFLEETGFNISDTRQTLFGNLNEITEIQKDCDGYGKGSFVAITAER